MVVRVDHVINSLEKETSVVMCAEGTLESLNESSS